MIVWSILTEKYVLYVFFFVSAFLATLLFYITFTLNTGTVLLDVEKTSAYECGFDPLESSRVLVDLKFYKVAISFIIFDIEIVFLYPWSMIGFEPTSNVLLPFSVFMLFLIIGLLFEYKSKCLQW
jgi:NADH-quinone oxidoreductase subunit A